MALTAACCEEVALMSSERNSSSNCHFGWALISMTEAEDSVEHNKTARTYDWHSVHTSWNSPGKRGNERDARRPARCTANKLLGDRDVTPLRVQSDVTSECTIWLAAVANGDQDSAFFNHAFRPHAYFGYGILLPSVGNDRY